MQILDLELYVAKGDQVSWRGWTLVLSINLSPTCLRNRRPEDRVFSGASQTFPSTKNPVSKLRNKSIYYENLNILPVLYRKCMKWTRLV